MLGEYVTTPIGLSTDMGVGKFLPDEIDASLCTHLIFAFAKLENNKLVNYEWNDVPPTWDTTKGGL